MFMHLLYQYKQRVASQYVVYSVFVLIALSIILCTRFVVQAKSDHDLGLVQPTAYYPLATAEDKGWELKGRLQTDLNGDGNDETVYIIFKAQGHGDEGPWQVYIEDSEHNITHVFARYLNHQQVQVFTGATPETADGDWSQLFLFNSGTASIALYEITYRGPYDYSIYELSNVLPLHWATNR